MSRFYSSLPGIFPGKLVSLLLAFGGFFLQGCDENGPDGGTTTRSLQVELTRSAGGSNAAGDVAYDFLNCEDVNYSTDAGDSGTALMYREGPSSMTGTMQVSGKSTCLWCFSPVNSVPSALEKSDATLEGMAFCSSTISLSDKEHVSGSIKPLTGAVVLNIYDSGGNWAGKTVSSVTMETSDGVSLAGDFSINLRESRIAELKNVSSSIELDCPLLSIGSSENTATSLATVVLPCLFDGTITVRGDGLEAVFTFGRTLTIQAGYVKRIALDISKAQVNGHTAKGFPKRLGVMGDSISSFAGIIPSTHRAYYPAGDVDKWEKTYWGLLATQYWNCEMDTNTSWSGSSVADGKAGTVRTPFVERCGLFTNPDVILLFGGTNDAIVDNQIGLGDFSYDTPLGQMNTTRRFRDAYIYVIRSIQEKYPAAQIICIIGTHVTGEYGASVETIARHYNLPYVDFRGDSKVSIYSGSHPNAAGHAYKAQKIYEKTLYLFQ